MASEVAWNPSLWSSAGGDVPSDWDLVPFGSLLQTPKSIAVGVMYPGNQTDGGVPLVRVGDVGSGGVVRQPSMAISLDVHNRYRRTELGGDELLITLVGTPGLCVLARPEMKGWNVARALAVAKMKRPELRPYIKAVLESSVMRSIILGMLNTTVQPTLNLKEIKILPVPMPQDPRVALELGSVAELFNNRIASLQRTNATLEAIAQALFKSWFVDFDPVRAKAEGREPEGMDDATAALFSSEFLDSELGRIPRSWTVGSIYDVADVRYGAPFKSALFNADRVGRPLVRIRDLRNEEPGVWTPEEHPKGYLIQPGDVIVGMDGEFRAYLWGGDEAWLNQRVCAFHPREPHGSVFVRNLISPLLARVESTVTATTVIHLGKKHIDEFRVLVPPPEIARMFCVMAQPLYERVVVAKQQARTLANLRDTLLPRLISGKLRLPEAEREIEAATA